MLTFVVLEHAVALAVVAVWATHLRLQRRDEREARRVAVPRDATLDLRLRTDKSTGSPEGLPGTPGDSREPGTGTSSTPDGLT